MAIDHALVAALDAPLDSHGNHPLGYGRHGQEDIWQQLSDHVAHTYKNAEGVGFTLKKRLIDTSYRPELVKRYIHKQNQTLIMGIDPMYGGAGWLDPVRKAQTAQLRMAIGISTHQDECGDQGKDWEGILTRGLPSRRALGLDMATLQTTVAVAPQIPEDDN